MSRVRFSCTVFNVRLAPVQRRCELLTRTTTKRGPGSAALLNTTTASRAPDDHTGRHLPYEQRSTEGFVVAHYGEYSFPLHHDSVQNAR